MRELAHEYKTKGPVYRRTVQTTLVMKNPVARRLLGVDYPDAERVVLVMDNLNTHSIGSL